VFTCDIYGKCFLPHKNIFAFYEGPWKIIRRFWNIFSPGGAKHFIGEPNKNTSSLLIINYALASKTKLLIKNIGGFAICRVVTASVV
jgi:hypothetical protein